jgi:hypothetical protein
MNNFNTSYFRTSVIMKRPDDLVVEHSRSVYLHFADWRAGWLALIVATRRTSRHEGPKACRPRQTRSNSSCGTFLPFNYSRQ